MVVLAHGIYVSTMSSGNSINCRMTNSRNSLIAKKLTMNPPSHNATARQVNTNRHEFCFSNVPVLWCPLSLADYLTVASPSSCAEDSALYGKNSRRTAPLCSQMLDGYRCRF